ncbi:MAG: hypothetical protein QNJ22_21200 [Desulfosarcinaceae bacterium]|nr:hypothetical protein [Desulfosarcinaceae bacterium]
MTYLRLVAVAVLLMTGCAAGTRFGRSEPTVIVIRNHSGSHIDAVTLSAADDAVSGGRRYGSISPVPDGATQLFARPAAAPRLPARLQLSWKTASGVRQVRVVSLTQLIRDRQAGADALVFEIQTGARILVYTASPPP